MGITKEQKARILELTKRDKEAKAQQQKELWVTLGDLREPGVKVPEIPKPITKYYIDRLIDCGAIEKNNLEDGVWYFGDYRNSKYGKWDAQKGKFLIKRYKWGAFQWDECYHFQDDDGFALFVPIRKATEEEIKKEENKE